MKGVVFLGDRKLELMDFPDPTPGPDEVVLEIKASGMCGSDLHFYRASSSKEGGAQSLGLGGDGSPVIAGHEPCGVVAARGTAVPVAQAPLGARVMCHHYSGCGICPGCRSGWSQLCSEDIVVYGVTGHGAHTASRPPERGFSSSESGPGGIGSRIPTVFKVSLKPSGLIY